MQNLDISLLILPKSKEMYQNELDAIDNQYDSSASDVKKSKFIEKVKIYKEWMNDLVRAITMADETIDNMKELIEQSKESIQRNGEQLHALRDDLEYVRQELQHDDSGIGEMLTATTNMDNHHIHFERRSIELSQAIDQSSHELSQLSEQMTKLNEAKASINSQYTDFQAKFDQLTTEAQEID
ncbi:uncharacterized protein LOC116344676 [Contarinia nasturtii]|uniref:uncharacterized protein LOC116344676 n=1 Tax=Contarinia nasturtii TaxID=265458 RepID=UPI0012D3E23D|nr:uncharacterized protein LOC116344676 [Contarinia nasturtii]